VGVRGGHIDQDAGLAVFGQLDAPHPADRKARKGKVHADHDAFRILSHQHQALGTFKRTPRIQHIQCRAAHQQQHEQHQQPGLEFQIGDRFRCGTRRGLQWILTGRRQWTVG